MALDECALFELLAQPKLTDVTDRIRVATETLYQELIDAEATAFIGASTFERTSERTTHRNGTRPRTLTTTAGELDLRIPKLRAGSFFPALLERRRCIDQGLFAVVMEAYLDGVSTRKVDDLVKELGADTGISKFEVSRICAGLDAEVAQFRDRTLSTLDYPYVFLDATYVKARVNHRIVSQAIVVAVGVAADGRREMLGFDDGDTENEGFWTAFLRSLKVRGLDGLKLVMSDAHSGLKKAISTVFQGASWERCRDHSMRNVLCVVSKGSPDMVASIIRTVFAQPDREHIHAQPDREHIHAQFDEVTRMLARSHQKVVTMLDDARNDLLGFACFPQRHWRQIWCTNPLERVNKQIKRRTDDVGAFPNPAAETKTTDPHGVEKLHHSARRYRSQPSPRPLSAECRIGRRGPAPRQVAWWANEDGSRAGCRLEQHGRDRGEPSLWVMRPRWRNTHSPSYSGVAAQNSVR
ncbi:IS256 family transposase [Salinibacterium xinjiangense]|uniref:Transposase (Or an inactivated derivative) n=1 Tax=Salinibacterium xinjiangense TaxID=386302 RepID=A0A2C8ZVA7_9MICO|nr:IS256 family transposase [Salinibacterium xinjiangense]SOE69550.1 Transposase (or an inactivated derivative) [Salinibacterium xinjiangense]